MEYIYICIGCGATARKKLELLSDPCNHPTPALRYNINAYKRGTAPKGFHGWPYKKICLEEHVAMRRFQADLEQVEREYKPQAEAPPSTSSDSEESEVESQQAKRPRLASASESASSESGSD